MSSAELSNQAADLLQPLRRAANLLSHAHHSVCTTKDFRDMTNNTSADACRYMYFLSSSGATMQEWAKLTYLECLIPSMELPLARLLNRSNLCCAGLLTS